MKILILSPLFPPDTGAQASYVKTLATELTSSHTVTLVLYGRLPESVLNASVIMLDKRWLKIRLMVESFINLLKANKTTDLFLINNGPSTELPALLFSYFSHTPIKLCISDPLAAKASQHGLYHTLHSLLVKRVSETIYLPEDEREYNEAEILPFTKPNQNAEERKKEWWHNHIQEITVL